MTGSALRFVFDFISANAYLAWPQVHALGERYGREVRPVPVLFAGLLNAHGREGPAEIPALWHWMARNCLRKAARLGIPLEPPPSHPFNPLLALRVASLPMPEETRRRVIDGLFRAVWAEGTGVTDPAQVARVVGEAGLDGEGALREAVTPQSKARLRRQTDEAIAEDVFGVPTMLVDDELFWGFDDLEQLESYLDGRDPLSRPSLAAWDAIRPTARRRRPKEE